MTEIRRLQGIAPPLIWPVDAIIPPIARCRELQLIDPARLCRPDERRWRRDLYAARGCAREAFAHAQGWTVANPASYQSFPPGWGLRDLRAWNRWALPKGLFEHGEWMRVGRYHVGYVIHVYDRLERVADLPPQFVVDELPESWYYPGNTKAFVIRPSGTLPRRATLRVPP